jgi:hypothetical protein
MSTNRKNTNVWGIPSMETYLTSSNDQEKKTLEWPILPGKYMQVLSISHKMADYFAFPLLL